MFIKKIIKKSISVLNKIIFKSSTQNTQDFNQGDVIECLAKIIRPKIYVEIGLYHSDVLKRIIPYADELIGTDIDPKLEKYFPHRKKTKFYSLSSDELLKVLQAQNKKIDFLFIDADHSQQAVLKDFYNYFPLVSEQGLIFLHDSYPGSDFYTQSGYCSDCYKAIIELGKNNDEYELVTIPKHPGLTICRKRKKHLSW